MFLAEDTLTQQTIDPGPVAFVAILFVGIVTLLLLADMIHRMRKVNMRAEINEKLDAEQASQEKSSSKE
jgi:hypothetical protein